MELSALAIFAGALIINAGSPGPSVAALVARVLSHGAGNVVPFLAAMWIGEAVWLSLAVFGLSYLAQTFYWGFAFLKYCGVGYLLYLAYKMWTAPVEFMGDDRPPAGAASRLFLTGLAITLGNPKLMVFYLALLPSLIDLARASVFGWVELVATMLVVLMAVDLAWVTLAAQARQWLKSRRAVRIANRASATTMCGAAVAIAAQ